MGQNRRRQIIVNKSLQSRVILSSMWVPCICLATSTVLLAVFCGRVYDQLELLDQEVPSVIPMFLFAVGFLVLAIVFTLLNGLRISHRIAGPIVNFGSTLMRFKAGDHAARIRLRRQDLLMEAAEKVNDFLDWTERQVGSAGTVSAEDADESGPESSPAEDPAELAELAEPASSSS